MNPLSTTLVNILQISTGVFLRHVSEPIQPTQPILNLDFQHKHLWENSTEFFHPTQNPPVTHHTKNHHQIRGESLRSCAPPLQVEVDFFGFLRKGWDGWDPGSGVVLGVCVFSFKEKIDGRTKIQVS